MFIKETEESYDNLKEENAKLEQRNRDLEARLADLSDEFPADRMSEAACESGLNRPTNPSSSCELRDHQDPTTRLIAQIEEGKRARKRLKIKTRELLVQYRNKRSALEKRKNALLSLCTLFSNLCCLVIRHERNLKL